VEEVVAAAASEVGREVRGAGFAEGREVVGSGEVQGVVQSRHLRAHWNPAQTTDRTGLRA
jgi:hypothetical protein